jgi:hypothetical protein
LFVLFAAPPRPVLPCSSSFQDSNADST